MAGQKVICESFRVHFSDGRKPKDFLKGENSEYQWSLTPSGDLLVYYKEYHATFELAAIRDERSAAYATGVWSEIEILKTEEEDATEEAESMIVGG